MMPENNRTPINVDRMLATFADDPEFIAEMYEMFVGDAQGLLVKFDAALQSGDAEELRKSAHTLKGTSANIGAERLQSLAGDVELVDLTQEPDKVQALANEMRMEMEAIEAFVRNYLQR